MNPYAFGVAAGVVSLVAYIVYAHDIVYGSTRPNRITWWIWALLSFSLLLNFSADGSRDAIWVPVVQFVGPFVIAILTLWKGETKREKFDRESALIAAIAILLYWIAPTIGLVTAIIADLSGAIPTVVKTVRDPRSESALGWRLSLVANVLNIFAISQWQIGDIYIVYLLLLTLVMTMITMRRS